MAKATSVERLFGQFREFEARVSRLEAKHAAFDTLMDQQHERCNIELRRFDEHQGVTTKFAEHLARIDEKISSIENKLNVISTMPWKIITGLAGIGTIFIVAAKFFIPWIKDAIK